MGEGIFFSFKVCTEFRLNGKKQLENDLWEVCVCVCVSGSEKNIDKQCSISMIFIKFSF